ncbi:transporter substrate-binding domain-containing protein [Devosia algicola]|uniref:Transporter substrate-binding domain-containing protein n=1 Tax=Devosia algicola TaxID=3026418 RepID=A0ABY7YQJ1_9HYPH|nr:transporter substrate-binding domain-containing protein [Devosia algicola]WDR03599.1 transporter substrate-binding domain-containing protein [Devosia algicola]
MLDPGTTLANMSRWEDVLSLAPVQIMNNRVAVAARLVLVCIGIIALVCTSAWATTLDDVRERGFLICGANAALPGFAEQDANGRWSGFDVDLCRAIAAAIFGNPDMIEFRPLRGESRFAPLQTGDLDVMMRDGPWTQKRDSVFGVRYVATSFFDGQAFMVPQSLGAVSAYELDNISICVLDGGDEQSQLQDFSFQIKPVTPRYCTRMWQIWASPTGRGCARGFRHRPGNCKRFAAACPIRPIIASCPSAFPKSLLGPVVRNGDDQWFKIVQWTLFALINAEEVGITSLNTDSLSAARTQTVRRILGTEGDFGTPLGLSPTFMKDAIQAVGNYGELYDRNFGPQTGAALLRGQNALWSNGGQMYAPPIR